MDLSDHRTLAHNARKPPQVRPVHNYNEILYVKFVRRYLMCAVSSERYALFAQLPLRRRIYGVVPFLVRNGSRSYLELIFQTCLADQILHHVLRHRASADVAMAQKHYLLHNRVKIVINIFSTFVFTEKTNFHMICFDSDYMSGAHPKVMERLLETNFEQTTGYGTDPYTARAIELIKDACGKPDARVHLLVGGTQTNATVIDGVLARHEGVMAAESGHINVHESGAIEATGHKVLTLSSYQGKVAAEDVRNFISSFYSDDTYEHMVAPGMLYISFPTEYGTVYSLNELEEISAVCHDAGIPLFIDGARLGFGLAAEGGDVTLKDLARLADVFYIGGTKVGALFGEAVVITNPTILKHFTPLVKQHGALLAKGRLLGLQFESLFSDGLYFEIGKETVRKAMDLRKAFEENGFKAAMDSPTNQQFFVLPNTVIDSLKKNVSFEMWGPRGASESTVRFVTGWSTTDQDIDTLKECLNQISK